MVIVHAISFIENNGYKKLSKVLNAKYDTSSPCTICGNLQMVIAEEHIIFFSISLFNNLNAWFCLIPTAAAQIIALITMYLPVEPTPSSLHKNYYNNALLHSQLYWKAAHKLIFVI